MGVGQIREFKRQNSGGVGSERCGGGGGSTAEVPEATAEAAERLYDHNPEDVGPEAQRGVLENSAYPSSFCHGRNVFGGEGPDQNEEEVKCHDGSTEDLSRSLVFFPSQSSEQS